MSWLEFVVVCALALVCSTLAVMAEDDDDDPSDWCVVNPGFTPDTPEYGVTRFATMDDALLACTRKGVRDERPPYEENIVFD